MDPAPSSGDGGQRRRRVLIWQGISRQAAATWADDGEHWVVGFDGVSSVEIKPNNEEHEVRCVRDALDE